MNSNPISTSKIIENNFTVTSNKDTKNLGKDEFLNLLVTQLKYQDPLKPMEDKQFIAQMAQFSSLEQMQNMNTSFTNVKAFGMIGKLVKGLTKKEDSSEVEEIIGIVEGAKLNNGKTYVTVAGRDILVDDINEVYDINYSTGPEDFTNLIDKNVDADYVDSETLDKITINGDVFSFKVINNDIYAVMNNVEVPIDDVVLGDGEKIDDMQEFLESKMEDEEEVTIVTIHKNEDDSQSRVCIRGKIGKLESSEDGERIKAVMNGVMVPAVNISSVNN